VNTKESKGEPKTMSTNLSDCLTKADLIDAIYDNMPFDKQKATQIVEDWIELIKEGLDKDSKVMISGFGVFEVKEKNDALKSTQE